MIFTRYNKSLDEGFLRGGSGQKNGIESHQNQLPHVPRFMPNIGICQKREGH